ncbi:MAG: hypothetical protein ABIR11_10730 [Candidatus Limnocylindrales bacterium]
MASSNRSASRAARALRAIALGALAAAVLTGPAAARTPVDPGTLNPAPPDFFNAECFAGAGGTVCTLHFSDDPIVGEPIGIVCAGTELLFDQERSVVGKRFYDANGDLVQRHFRESFSGTITNPDTGKSLFWEQHDTVIHNLAVAGDVASGNVSFTGLAFRAWLPGGGTVLIDSGRSLQVNATGEIIRESGQHHFTDYFVNGNASALQPICDALD